jgi:hypothetical protein
VVAVIHAFAHLFVRIFVNWYTFLGTSPGGIGAQVALLILTELKGGWWRVQNWRDNWRGGLKRGAQALGAVWAIAFIVCTISTVYDDHAALGARTHAILSENMALRHKNEELLQKQQTQYATISQQAQRIKTLESAPPKTIVRTEKIPVPVASSGSAQPPVSPDVIAELGRLLSHGTAAQNKFIATNDVKEFRQLRGEWITEVNAFLARKVGDAYAISFRNAHGNAFMGCPTNHSVDGCGDWQDIEGKKDMLMQILSELRRR